MYKCFMFILWPTIESTFKLDGHFVPSHELFIPGGNPSRIHAAEGDRGIYYALKPPVGTGSKGAPESLHNNGLGPPQQYGSPQLIKT